MHWTQPTIDLRLFTFNTSIVLKNAGYCIRHHPRTETVVHDNGTEFTG